MLLPRVVSLAQRLRLRGWARGGGGRLARCAWGHLRGGVHVGAEGLLSKARASRTWCVVWGAHGGPPLLHVAIGTGHPGGGIYPMGLCREGAEDVEHPTEFLLKAHGHVVELVESCINLLLPRLEVVQHTGRIHRIVTRLAMDLDGAGDVAHGLVDVPQLCALPRH
jgi:hypothetical protein